MLEIKNLDKIIDSVYANYKIEQVMETSLSYMFVVRDVDDLNVFRIDLMKEKTVDKLYDGMWELRYSPERKYLISDYTIRDKKLLMSDIASLIMQYRKGKKKC